MKFKIEAKDKFHVITLNEPSLSVDMAAKLSDMLLTYLQTDIKNIILNLKELEQLDEKNSSFLSKLQQIFVSHNSSFVVCELQKPVLDFLSTHHQLNTLNYTLTESEAWDIIQMEEIERELLND